jgi:hypothetical protein
MSAFASLRLNSYFLCMRASFRASAESSFFDEKLNEKTEEAGGAEG